VPEMNGIAPLPADRGDSGGVTFPRNRMRN
jgi:hypothetical protein